MRRDATFIALAVTVTTFVGAEITNAESPAAVASSVDDGWRRTANGWEIWPKSTEMLARRELVPNRPRPKTSFFPGSAHPLAWGGLQLSLSLLALGFFPSKEE